MAEAALKDASSGVREQAVRLARVETLLDFDDPDARVRMELAYRMGETDDPRATDVLARLAEGADVWLRNRDRRARRSERPWSSCVAWRTTRSPP